MPCMNTPSHTPVPSTPRTVRRSGWSRLCRVCAMGWFLAAWALQQGVSAAPAHSAEAQAFGPLISASALAARRDQVRIIDLRDAAGEADVAHIPGALPAPYADWRGPASNPGQLRPLPEFTALVRRLGLTAETLVVLVATGDDPSDFGAPARVYWTLKWLGLRHLAILNGGMTAWQAAGLPLTREPTPAAAPSAFTPQLDGTLLATRTDVAQDLARPGTLLLDARPRAFFLGREKAPAARRPGTLPGALDFDNLRWFEPGSGALPDTATLERIAQDLPQPLSATPTHEVVSFCNTGHWAATNWFVLSQVLHRPHVALYPGSMVDWSRADAPMAHVPTRWQQLRQQWERTWQAL